jgi:hypothetical protein
LLLIKVEKKLFVFIYCTEQLNLKNISYWHYFTTKIMSICPIWNFTLYVTQSLHFLENHPGTFSLPEYLLPDHLSVHPILQFQILWGLQNNVYCFLKTVKNEGILTSAIFFSLPADWVAETVGIQNNILTVLESNFIFDYLQMFQIDLISFIVLNATFSNISAISWWPVLVVEETEVPRENHRPWAINW